MVIFQLPEGDTASGSTDNAGSQSLARARPLAKKHKHSVILLHTVSATAGSLLAETLLFPVDTVKLQVQTAGLEGGGGFFATLVRIVSNRGLGSLYQGLIGALVKESFHSSNFWLWHGLLFKYVAQHDDTSRTPSMTRLLLNLVAKQVNWLCTVPFEVVSSVNQLKGNGFFLTARALHREHGIGVFYRGLTVSMILAINPAIMNTLITSLLALAARIKQAYGTDYADAREHSVGTTGLVTGIAKMIATLLTYPLIRTKVLQQTQVGTSKAFMEVLRGIVATEGASGLYRGVLAMSYKTVLWNSLMQVFKKMLGPPRAATPPGSPRALQSTMPTFMGREAFPSELVTSEKLDEILAYLKMERGRENQRRVANLEQRLDATMGEIQEVKHLLADLVKKVDKNLSGPSTGTPGDCQLGS